MPSIDVVIPNYNYGRYLQASATSVLSQTGVDVRLLIIDNASTDDSPAIARHIASHDPRVELRLRTQNHGPHASFNEGVDWADADYFLILCSDDILAPGALARAASFLDRCPDVHLAHGATSMISTDGMLPETNIQDISDQWFIQAGNEFIEFACRYALNPVAGPTAIVRTAIQKRLGHYRPALPHTDDLEMWLRIAMHGNIAVTGFVQAFARIHPHNQSATVKGILHWNHAFEAAFRSFFEHEGENHPDAVRLLQAVQNRLTKRAYWSAIANLTHGEKGAAQLFAFAFRRRPVLAIFPPVDYLLNRPSRALARQTAEY
ncbi:glycosyltransferase family 2 protein [Ochrobactrum sp. CM-21-5]|nr:glycosyltransferase family 2 protein [Ochrobactrum sp. CM-21-5]MBC2886427.1 glycosyltransferase family 2 protein [Ochrobactrum sp. CM-21-5]